MKITLDNLKVGMKIFRVQIFHNERQHAQIYEYKVLEFPVEVPSCKHFMRVKTLTHIIKANFDKKTWERDDNRYLPKVEMSMRDMGIIPNTYNNHQTFDSLAEAKRYICSFHKVNFKEPSATDYDRAMGALDL